MVHDSNFFYQNQPTPNDSEFAFGCCDRQHAVFSVYQGECGLWREQLPVDSQAQNNDVLVNVYCDVLSVDSVGCLAERNRRESRHIHC